MAQDPDLSDETKEDFYTIDLPGSLGGDVALHHVPDYHYGNYAVTCDVYSENDGREGRSWSLASSREDIPRVTKKVVADATGRALLGLKPEGKDRTEISEFRRAKEDIEYGL